MRRPRLRLPMLVVAATATLALVAGLIRPKEALANAPATHIASALTYRDVLGEAVNYGIVAETFMLEQGDAQTNVAAQVATSKTQTGNDLTNPVKQPFLLARVPDAFRIKGYDAYVHTNADDAHKVVGTGSTAVEVDTTLTADELHAQVGDMLVHARSQSQAMAAQEATAQVAYDEPSQKYVLDIRDLGAGTHYVTLDDETYARICGEASKLRIFKNADQTIVLNVAASAQALQKFDVNGQGADAFLDGNAGDMPQGIVWNFPQATDLTIAGSVTGVILAPEATVSVEATSSGWLVAQSVVIGNGEWHNVFQQVVPGGPMEPSDPQEPENPEEPTDPDNPVEPETPEEPEVPADPSDPDTPIGPEGSVDGDQEPEVDPEFGQESEIEVDSEQEPDADEDANLEADSEAEADVETEQAEEAEEKTVSANDADPTPSVLVTPWYKGSALPKTGEPAWLPVAAIAALVGLLALAFARRTRA